MGKKVECTLLCFTCFRYLKLECCVSQLLNAFGVPVQKFTKLVVLVHYAALQ